MAWLSGWAKRMKITVDSDDIDADLTHFPLMVHLSATCGIDAAFDASPIFDEVGANSQKIAVTKSDGDTEIYCEVEYWDSGGEEAILWVSKSDLVIANASDTDLYIYYDNTHADNTTYIGLCADGSTPTHAVWDSNFKAVYHMADATTSSILDSTSNNNDGTKKGANEPIEGDGKIGKAQHFEPTDDSIQCGNDVSLRISPTLTMELWVKYDTVDQGGTIGLLGIWDTTAKRSYSLAIGNDETITFFGSDDGSWTTGHRLQAEEDIAYSINTWYYQVATFDSGTANIYRDTVDITITALDEISTLFSTDANFTLGCHLTNTAPYRWFDGWLDEVRVSDIVRSAEYRKACYECQRDHLLSFGSEEILSVVVGGSIVPLLRVLDII